MSDILYLPVSIGEAMDKLSILDIKLEFITDEKRKNEVKKEYDMLYEKLQDNINKYENFYKIMKKVNKDIWFMMDILRDSKNISNEEYDKKCRECIDANDIRFRIKNKINNVTKSVLKEQKSYNILTRIFDLKNNTIDLNQLIDLIKYNSYIYDEIIIICADENLKILTDVFNYDNTIKIVESWDVSIDTKVIQIEKYKNITDIFMELNLTHDMIKSFI